MNTTKILFILGVALFAVLALGSFFVAGGDEFNLENNPFSREVEDNRPQKLENPPSPIRGIYVTSWTAGTQRMDELITLVQETELNAVVIDVKDATGYISFPTSIPLANEIGAHERRIPDIDELIRRLHTHNIYVIGRVQVFQDPVLATARPGLAVKDSRTGGLWYDDKGIAWLDPAHREVWEYTLAIAREMDAHGFDEVNLDYVRFPSDGAVAYMQFPTWDTQTPRYEVIRSFFSYIQQEAGKEDIRLSADIFGMTTLFTQRPDFDLFIGQRLIDALETLPIISPMVYPSHYGPGVLGFANPAEHPYQIIYASLKQAQELRATTTNAAILRPWLQDFDLGADYGPAQVRAQMQAAYDVGVEGWLLWNPSSRYTRGALGL